MVERVHARVAEAVAYGVTVPAFPYSRRTLQYRIFPGRILSLLKQSESGIGMTVFAEHGQKQRTADKSRSQLCTVIYDLFIKRVGEILPVFFRYDLKRYSKQV